MIYFIYQTSYNNIDDVFGNLTEGVFQGHPCSRTQCKVRRCKGFFSLSLWNTIHKFQRLSFGLHGF
jgi:hypothetical protein